MDEQFERILIECLDELHAGVSIQRLLARHPDDAETLRPILETALTLQEVRPAPTSSARFASRRLFLNQAATQRPGRGRLFVRMATLIMALIVCVLIGGGSIVASATALPGDVLYGVKQTVEQVRLTLATDRSGVEQDIDATRRGEVRQLIVTGRTAHVRFRGSIERIEATTLEVAGLTVSINSTTRLIGQPRLGLIAVVDGQVLGDRIDASQIIIQTITDNAAPTVSATPTATTAPTATLTATVPATPVPTVTLTPSVEPSVTAIPTAQPTTTVVIPTRISSNTPVIRVTQPSTLPPTATPPVLQQPTAEPEPTQLPSPTQTNDENENRNSNENSNGNDDNANANDNSNADQGNENESDSISNRNKNVNDNNNENTNANENNNENKNTNDNNNENKNDNKNDNTNSKP